MRLNPVQLAQLQALIDRAERARRDDGLIVGEYRFRLEELVVGVFGLFPPVYINPQQLMEEQNRGLWGEMSAALKRLMGNAGSEAAGDLDRRSGGIEKAE